ncbi:chromate transporter [Rhodopila sp.]|uniref:chromate transporter n=1 Tax=Rhodopila sp. TaxID=2480087 RepID=UPI003D0DA4B6
MTRLTELAAVYAQFSLLAFGGANAVLPEMQRQVVDVHHWMTARDFAALFALAQAAPGPNMMVVSLIGWRVAGLSGALVTTVSVLTPSSLLTLIVSGVWYRFKDAPWRKALQAGLQPVSIGLIMASAALLIEATAVDAAAAVVTVLTAALFLCTKLHPMLILGGAAIAGAIGLVG